MTLNYNPSSPAAPLLGPGLPPFEPLTNQISPPAPLPGGAYFGGPDDKYLGLVPLFWKLLNCPMAWTYILRSNFISSDQGGREEWYSRFLGMLVISILENGELGG